MSENTNCPSCHASITYEKGSYRRWCCGSWDDGHTGYQTDTCQLRHTDRQLVQANAENKRLKAIVADLVYAGNAILDPVGRICRHDHHGACQNHSLRSVQRDDGTWEYECEVPLMIAAIEAAKAAREKK